MLTMLRIYILVSGVVILTGGEYAVLHTECQCTCPISRLQLRDAIGKDEQLHMLRDDPNIASTMRVQTTKRSSPTSPIPTSAPSTASVTTASTATATPTTSFTTKSSVHKSSTTTEPSNKYDTESRQDPDDVTPAGFIEGSGYFPGSEVFTDGFYVDEFKRTDDEDGPQRGDPSDRISEQEVDVKANPDDEMHGEPLVAVPQAAIIAGPKGERGLTGPQGLQGAEGPPGLDGVDGLAGKDGLSGVPGRKGEKGDKGDQGPRGYAGSMGIQGYRGAPGPIGETGRAGSRGGDGARGARGERGSMGQRGLPGKFGTKGESGEPGLPGKNAEEILTTKTQVAFLARLMEHFGPSTINANIVFSQVDFNLGTGYEAASGSFVVPTDGVYIFHLQVMAMADYIAWLALKVNGEPVAYAWASGYTSSVEQMGTTMTFQQLKRGDVVNVIQKASDTPANYLYAHYTLFSGYLLGQ